jgi:ABC-type multidrug transport system ATPase subunit/pSer/pThr/pTyr-binding forkhead associated (FHA) protein
MKSYPALYFPEVKRFEPLSGFGDKACVVGRSPSANIVVPDPTCAREQFAVSAVAGGYKVEPLSRNVPTLYNDDPLSGPANLKHNDKIRCGFTTVVYLDRDSGEFASAQATIVGDFREAVKAQRDAAEIRLDRNLILGRAPGREGVSLDHPRVSRNHAEIQVAEGKVSLRDLGSSNGTFVNGERIEGLRELRPNDRIDIDPFSFIFTGLTLLPSSREGKLRVIGRNLTTIVRDHAGGATKPILEDVSLVIEPGEFVCILGASGAGKSTVMKALSARALADKNSVLKGTVFLNELSLYANFQALKQNIALVPQKDVLYEDLTLRACIVYSARLRLPADSSDKDIQVAVDEALERVGLKDLGSTPVRHLSGGQKKRAALANETVSRPDLLFLDEVTSGLDEGTDWEMMDLFKRLARNHGMTIICVTHTVANVDLCDKVILMTASEENNKRGPGMLAYYGPPAGARLWFGVEKLGEVYRKMPAREGRSSRDRYLASDEFQRYIGQPLSKARVDQPAETRAAESSGRERVGLAECIRQFRILTSRYFRLLSADRGTLRLAAAQSALIGLFLVMVFGGSVEPGPKQVSLLFFLGISCFWCGCNNASKEIVKEQALYRIERDVNLSLTAYLASKIAVLTLFGVLQVSLLFGLVRIFGTVPGGDIHQFLCMCVSVIAGTSTGLFLSSVASTEDQASTLVPIALIPQILLSGVVVPDLRAVPDFVAHTAISGFWVARSMQAGLPGGIGSVRQAMLVLAAHIVCFWGASWWVLRSRDARK